MLLRKEHRLWPWLCLPAAYGLSAETSFLPLTLLVLLCKAGEGEGPGRVFLQCLQISSPSATGAMPVPESLDLLGGQQETLQVLGLMGPSPRPASIPREV